MAYIHKDIPIDIDKVINHSVLDNSPVSAKHRCKKRFLTFFGPGRIPKRYDVVVVVTVFEKCLRLC